MIKHIERPEGVFPENVTMLSNIVYSQLLCDEEAPKCSAIPGNPRKRPLTLSMLRPEMPFARPGMKVEPKRFPCVIHLSGGGFELFERDQSMPALAWLAEAGYIVVDIEYRKSSESKWPGAVYDVKTAIRFLRKYAAHFCADPDKIALFGSSAGGYLSAFCAATNGMEQFDTGEHLDADSRVQAAIDRFGPIDFLRLDEDDEFKTFMFEHNDARSPESQFMGAALTEIPDKCARANPLTYIEANKDNLPDMLLMHGASDGDVPLKQSRRLHDALAAAGKEPELVVYEGVGHGQDRAWNSDIVRQEILGFLNKRLK